MIHEKERIEFRLLNDAKRYEAIVLSSDDNRISFKSQEPPIEILKGKSIVVTIRSEDQISEYYAEVYDIEGDMVMARWMWEKSRQYFRVDDAFPVDLKKVENIPIKRSRVFLGYPAERENVEVEAPDETISPKLWKLLTDINTKLSLILEKLQFDEEGFIKAEMRHVNVSASGIKFRVDEKVEIGDTVEIKMLLPTCPPTGIITYGSVVRSKDLGNGQYEVALHFTDIEDEVRDEIIQYTLKRQRELIRRQRQQKGE
ncbi:MAG: PilZ domain-containing protein [Thermodesulfovibrionales bacterium]